MILFGKKHVFIHNKVVEMARISRQFPSLFQRRCPSKMAFHDSVTLMCQIRVVDTNS